VISLVSEWVTAAGEVERRTEDADMGGTLRLGAQPAVTVEGTLARAIYGERFAERHRHRYEVNPAYIERLRAAGLTFGAFTEQKQLTEMIEIAGHPFFVAVQFHPEFSSGVQKGHPLFTAFIRAALEARQSKAPACGAN
jgi:CTP synthase